MLSVPKSKVVRGFSIFGESFVYVIFEDGTDIYWARARVLEYLNFAAERLPAGVTPALGPDATGVGWVYQYAVAAKDRASPRLRAIQDWYLRYQLAKAEGVAEVASVGRLRAAVPGDRRSAAACAAYGIPLRRRPRGDPREQHRRRRALGRDGRERIHGPRPRLPARRRRHRRDRAQGRQAARRYCCATSRASSLARTSAAASPN